MMFTIGAFATLGGVSARMLRHYDRIGLLEPEEVDPETGYRYYRAAQLPRLKRLMTLKDMGFSLEEVGVLLASDRQAHAMLADRQRELEAQRAVIEAQIKRVDDWQRYLGQVGDLPAYIVQMRSVPDQRVVMRQVQAADQIAATIKALEEGVTPAAGPPYALLHPDAPLEVVLPVRAAPQAVTLAGWPHMGCVTAPLDALDEALSVLATWVQVTGWCQVGPVRQVFTVDGLCEVQVPLEQLDCTPEVFDLLPAVSFSQ